MFSILPLKAILIRALLARLALIRHQQRARRSHLARSPRVRLESRRTQEPWRIGLPTRSLTRYKKISAGFIDRSDCGSQSVQHGMSALVNCRHSTGPGAFPLYPRKQTSELSSVTSALGQKRKCWRFEAMSALPLRSRHQNRFRSRQLWPKRRHSLPFLRLAIRQLVLCLMKKHNFIPPKDD
jgi:hypothetical protein